MNTLQKQFSDALKREGKTITGFYNKVDYKCLFRKNNKSENDVKDYVTIFYDILTPIYQGQLLSYGGKHFITLNQESVENDVYYKSALLECNTRMIVGVDGIGHIVPCYSSNLKAPLPSEGKIITTLDGNIELMTEDNYIGENIFINNRYILMGGTWQVINKVDKSGIYYFYMQRLLNAEPVYSLTTTTEFDTYSIDDTVETIILPTADGITDPEATIICTSSDTSIATVTNTGLITCISAGSVIITVTWLEQNLTKTVTLTVKDNAPLIYVVTITGDWEDNNQMLGIEHTFSATVKDSLGNPVTTTNLVYSTTNVDTALNGYITLTDNHNGTGKVIVGDFDDNQLITKTFDLVCTDTLSGFSGSVTLTIVGLY